jgi:F-type H+-transporting ATPase subunit delta
MARPATSARRYAEAAFEIAQRDGTVEEWRSQLDRVAGALSDQAAVRRLEDPAVPLEVRAEALTRALGSDLLPVVRNLVLLVLRRRRLEQMSAIAGEFRRLYNRRAGVVEATAYSAQPLTEADVAELERKLQGIVDGRLELSVEVDPALIGGIAVRLGDRLIDGSVRGRLERLRNSLIAAS